MRVYTGGTFDNLHVGHIDLLNWCGTLAGHDGEVIVALNTDEFVEQYKGNRPIFSYAERKAVLMAIRGLVDMVVPNEGGADSRPTILEVKPDIVVIGSDWLRKDYCKQMGFDVDWLENERIALCYVPRHIQMSSTEIKSRIKSA